MATVRSEQGMGGFVNDAHAAERRPVPAPGSDRRRIALPTMSSSGIGRTFRADFRANGALTPGGGLPAIVDLLGAGGMASVQAAC